MNTKIVVEIDHYILGKKKAYIYTIDHDQSSGEYL